jgi:hypothetical protein
VEAHILEWTNPPGPSRARTIHPTTQPTAAQRTNHGKLPTEIQQCDEPGQSWADRVRQGRSDPQPRGSFTSRSTPTRTARAPPKAPGLTTAAPAGVKSGAQLPPTPRVQPAAAKAGRGPGVPAAVHTSPATPPPPPPPDYGGGSDAEATAMGWQTVSRRRRNVSRKARVGDGSKRQALPPQVATNPASHIAHESRYLALVRPGDVGGTSSAGHISG